MHLAAHHIRTMHRQLTMVLDGQFTLSPEAWTDFVQSLLVPNDSSENPSIVSGLLTDILGDELYASTYSSAAHSRFILDVQPEVDEGEDEGEGRSPEDVRHLATVLAILLTHTINVTFDSRGVPCAVHRSRVEVEVSEKAAEKKKPVVVEEKKVCGSGGELGRVFSPPAEPIKVSNSDALKGTGGYFLLYGHIGTLLIID